MSVTGKSVAVTLQLPRDVYERVSEEAACEQRPFVDLLSHLVVEGLDAHADLRKTLEHISSQYRSRLSRERKLDQAPDEVLEELRQIREQIARELYPG